MVTNEAVGDLYWLRDISKEFDTALTRIDNWSEEEMRRWVRHCGIVREIFKMAGVRDEALIHAWCEDALKHLASTEGRKLIPRNKTISRKR